MIINNVRRFRKKKNLTQEELSKRVGVSRKTIVSLEKGNYIPSLMLALNLAAALDVDINELFYLET